MTTPNAAPHADAGGVLTVIRPNRGWTVADWRELWAYRDLLYLLVRRDFLSKYKQTILGPAWFVLQPLLMTIVFTVVFGRIARIGTDGVPPLLFYLCNMLGWNYLAQNVLSGATTFTTNAHLFGKVYFPRLVVPVSIVVSNAFAFALSFLMFLGFFSYFRIFVAEGVELAIPWQIVFVPLLLLQTAALSLGVSLLLAASTAKYRDLAHVTPLLVQIWMFATIILPVSSIPPHWQWIVWANPMSAIVEAFRVCLLGAGTLTPAFMAASVGLTLALLLAGVVIFRRVERTVVDTA